MAKNNFVENTPEVSSVMGSVDTFIRWREKNKEQRGYEIYHPSAFGACLRAMQYNRYVAMGFIVCDGDDFDSRILRLFETGLGHRHRLEPRPRARQKMERGNLLRQPARHRVRFGEEIAERHPVVRDLEDDVHLVPGGGLQMEHLAVREISV